MEHQTAHQPDALTPSKSNDITTTSQPYSAVELLRQAGVPEWEVTLFLMAQDKRHDLMPEMIESYWRVKLRGHSDEAINTVLLEWSGKYFPSVDEVIGALDAYAERRYIEREAEKENREKADREAARRYNEEHPEIAEEIRIRAKELENAMTLGELKQLTREPTRSPRNVIALSQSKALKHA